MNKFYHNAPKKNPAKAGWCVFLLEEKRYLGVTRARHGSNLKHGRGFCAMYGHSRLIPAKVATLFSTIAKIFGLGSGATQKMLRQALDFARDGGGTKVLGKKSGAEGVAR